MHEAENLNLQKTARIVGWSLLGSVAIGILASQFLVNGIDINLTANVSTTAENMLGAEARVRGKAYLAALMLCIEAIIAVGMFLLVRRTSPLVAGSSLFVSLAASLIVLLGAVFALNVAEFASNPAYSGDGMASDTNLMLTSLQVTSSYTSFHLALVLSALANAGFFYLFLKSSMLPKLLASWGLFASLFVASMIVARDFIPALGSDMVTIAFMLSNLVAIVGTGLYLGIRGVRTE